MKEYSGQMRLDGGTGWMRGAVGEWKGVAGMDGRMEGWMAGAVGR